MSNPLAFPWEDVKDNTGLPYPEPGMTLRDYFAAKALSGSMQHWEKMMTDEQAERLAKWCYRWADAMLAERDKPCPTNS